MAGHADLNWLEHERQRQWMQDDLDLIEHIHDRVGRNYRRLRRDLGQGSPMPTDAASSQETENSQTTASSVDLSQFIQESENNEESVPPRRRVRYIMTRRKKKMTNPEAPSSGDGGTI